MNNQIEGFTQTPVDRMKTHAERLRKNLATLTSIGEIQGPDQTKEQRLKTLEHLAGTAVYGLLAVMDAVADEAESLGAIKESLERAHQNIEALTPKDVGPEEPTAAAFGAGPYSPEPAMPDTGLEYQRLPRLALGRPLTTSTDYWHWYTSGRNKGWIND